MRTDGPGQSALLLLDAVVILEREGVGYAVVGAMAGSVHGVVRASVDADAVVSVGFQELSKLADTFRTMGLAAHLRRGDPDDPIDAVLALRDSHDNQVDLLAGLRGLEPAAFSRSVEVSFQGQRLRIIGREDFIAMKLYAGGPVDLDDARKAIAFGRESLNLELLERLAGNYGERTLAALKAMDR
jgi:hypothetical protein